LDPTIRAPQGPRLDRAIPTGPKAERTLSELPIAPAQPAISSPSNTSTSKGAELEPVETESDDMPRPGGRGRGGGPSKGGHAPKRLEALAAPIMDRAGIIETYGRNVVIKPEWAENPKSPFANHIGNKMAIKYEAQSGMISGKKMIR